MLLDGESDSAESAPALPLLARSRWIPDVMRTRERKRTVGAGACGWASSGSPRAGLRLIVIRLLPPNDDGLAAGPAPGSNCSPSAFSGKMGDLESEYWGAG